MSLLSCAHSDTRLRAHRAGDFQHVLKLYIKHNTSSVRYIRRPTETEHRLEQCDSFLQTSVQQSRNGTW
jgi:hypothetical protein